MTTYNCGYDEICQNSANNNDYRYYCTKPYPPCTVSNNKTNVINGITYNFYDATYYGSLEATPAGGSVDLKISNKNDGTLLYKFEFTKDYIFTDETIVPFIVFANQKIDELGLKSRIDLSDFANRIVLFASQYLSEKELKKLIDGLTQELLDGSISLEEYDSQLENSTKEIMDKIYNVDLKIRFDKVYNLLESLGFTNYD